MMEMSPFDFFRQESSHSDVVVRTEAMARVAIIASLMGPEKTRSEMLPYLQAKMDDMDQVLLAVARRIGDFVPICGGPEHAHFLIPVIEALSAVEETTVRATAAEGCCKILSQLGPANKASIAAYLAMFKRISNEEASGDLFYSRVTACQIVHELYRIVSDQAERDSIKEIFSTLTRDEMVMVKRAAAMALPKLAAVVEDEVLTGDMLQLMKQMAVDEYQNIKIIAIENCVPFSQVLHDHNVSGTAGLELIPIIRAATDDHSWRVRLAISKNYGHLAACYPPEVVAAELLPGLVNLLQDTESDVRIQALEDAFTFFGACGCDLFINETAALVQTLVEDPNVTVRKNLAELCVNVAANATGEGPGHTAFVDIVCRLLADEDPLVRLRVIKKVPLIAEQVAPLCAKISPSLKIMFGESNWRVRKELSLAMPSVLKFMGADFFTETFQTEYLAVFKDGVNEVREAVAASLTDMVRSSSALWVYDNIFPTIRNLADDEFLYRKTMLDCVLTLASEPLPERFVSELISLFQAKCCDVVASIRIRAAQVGGGIGPKLGRDIFGAQVKPSLLTLLNDKDKDVKYFAAQSLTANGE